MAASGDCLRRGRTTPFIEYSITGSAATARRDLDLRDLDQLTFAGAAPVLERSEQGDAGVHPDDGIGGPL